jgi:hypothetical protein
MTDSRRNPEQKTSSQGPLPPYDVMDRHARLDVERAFLRYQNLNTQTILYVALVRSVNMGLHTGSILTTAQYFIGRISLEEVEQKHRTSAVPMSTGMGNAVGQQNLLLIHTNQAPNSAVLFLNEYRELKQNRDDARRAGRRDLYIINSLGVAGTLAGAATDTGIRVLQDAYSNHTVGRVVSNITEIGVFAIQSTRPSTPPRSSDEARAQESTPDARRMCTLL